MYDNVPEHIWPNMWSPYGQHSVFLAQTISQISSKISNFEHQISLGNVTLSCKDIHPLLIECFPTSCRCIRMMKIASVEICDPLVVNTVSFLAQTPLKCQVTYPMLSTRSARKMWHHCVIGHPSIAAWVFPNLPYMFEKDWKSIWQNIRSPCCQHNVFSTQNPHTFQAKSNPIWAPDQPGKCDTLS